ncbi:DUF2066 domain-containing protein [Psychrobium sp. MM17-31]|uniref:DUF2066 domain-containing protein n=1 Tax=Psychrobium sp. MM17-31 TaxID=2917758 RepID=UPI001EF58E08|nr:DUF2066 domain-containing protein [Psychrobium sp. MM17-31]
MFNKSVLFSSMLLAASLSVSNVALAQSNQTLYQASAPVSGQSNTARNEAIKSMFGQVLVKVSGQSKITEHPTIQQEIAKALSYASGFGFNQTASGNELAVTFNEQLIDELLKQNGFTLWDAERPSVMLWLVYEDEQGNRQILNEQSSPQLLADIKKIAKVRGLPLLVPLWDLDDQMVVSAGDVWGQFEDKVAVANARYRSDYMILGKVTNYGFSKNVSWSVFKMGSDVDIFGQTSADISMTGSDDATSLNGAFNEIINQSTDFFAKQYSVDTTAKDGDMMVTLTNIDSLRRYAQAVEYLKSIKAVEDVVLVKVKANEYSFKVQLLGSRDSFLDLINLGSKMSQIVNYDPSLVLFEWRG